MSMLIQYKQLWRQGGYGRDNPFSNTVAFLYKRADEMTLPREAVDLILAEVFEEVANGRKFPILKCPCGCGIDKSGTAITHEMLARLTLLNWTAKNYQTELIERRWNLAISEHIKEENAKYLAEALKPSKVKRAWLWMKSQLLAPVRIPLPRLLPALGRPLPQRVGY